jgi:hypothetical protein
MNLHFFDPNIGYRFTTLDELNVIPSEWKEM